MESFNLDNFNDPLCVIANGISLFNMGLDVIEGENILRIISESADLIVQRFVRMNFSYVETNFKNDPDFKPLFFFRETISKFKERADSYIVQVAVNEYYLNRKERNAAELSQTIGMIKAANVAFQNNIMRLKSTVGVDLKMPSFMQPN